MAGVWNESGQCVKVLSLSCDGCGMVGEALTKTIIPAGYMAQPYWHGLYSKCGGRITWQTEAVEAQELDDVDEFHEIVMRCNIQTPTQPRSNPSVDVP